MTTSHTIAHLSIGAALLAGAILPGAAAAADLYGYEGGGPPPFYRGAGDPDRDGARFWRREDPRPAFGYRGGPGPAAFDERGPFGPPADRGYRRPVVVVEGTDGDRRLPPPPRPVVRTGYGPAYGYRPAYGYGPGYGFGPGYGYGVAGRPVAFAGPAYRDGPDVGCTTDQTQSITPAGWRKVVTWRTCYRR